MSGHSKWASIKHQKGVTDARRGQLFTKLTREIIIAAKEGGGSADMNFRLRLAVQKAKEANMPSDNIDRAIKKGTGEIAGGQLTELTLEGYGPNGIAILVNALADNRNRAIQDVRSTFTKFGGSLGEAGCVAWMFDNKGVITINPGDRDPEEIGLAAIDAGAEDVDTEGDYIEVTTLPEDLEKVREALEQEGVAIESGETSMVPKTMVELDEKAGVQALRFMERLEELDDVQNVYSNADIPASAAEAYAA
jgi:YebC/PmpR family DNA-binding regulatory protein